MFSLFYRNRKFLRPVSILLLVLTLLLCCVPVSAVEGPPYTIEEESARTDPNALDLPLSALDGKSLAFITGTPYENIVGGQVQAQDYSFYTTVSDLALALHEGKIDAYANNTYQWPYIAAEYPEITYFNQPLYYLENGAIFPKNDEGIALRDQFNEYLRRLTADGTLDALKGYWLQPNDWEVPTLPATGENGVLKFCTASSMKPFSFMLNGQHAGLDIALVAGFCQEYGYGIKVDDSDLSGMLSGIATGKYDFASGQIAWSQERADKVYYSDLYVTQYVVAYVRRGAFGEEAEMTDTKETFFEKVASGFKSTFIDQSRWKMIVKGIGLTAFITVFGFLLANIFGALFCAMVLSGKKPLLVIYDIYSRLMQGTPILVVLMILYYVIFNNSDLSGAVVSIFGFGLSIGAYLAQLFAGSIKAIDVGQTEAALMLGMKKSRAFLGIVLPQAIRSMLPAYFSQFISLMKSTSIVGYIAVMDLTKASDVIRSSTYEAFFPLLSSAAIYFLISSLLLSLLKSLQKKLAPKRRKATSKEEKDA